MSLTLLRLESTHVKYELDVVRPNLTPPLTSEDVISLRKKREIKREEESDTRIYQFTHSNISV